MVPYRGVQAGPSPAGVEAPMLVPVPDTEPEWPFCPRCGEHTGWEVDAVEGLVSHCCFARPMSVDVEPRED